MIHHDNPHGICENREPYDNPFKVVAALSSDKPAILTGNMMSSQCFETENSSQLKRWHPYQWHRITTGQNDQLDHRGGSAPRDKRLLAISLSLSQPAEVGPTDGVTRSNRPRAQPER